MEAYAAAPSRQDEEETIIITEAPQAEAAAEEEDEEGHVLFDELPTNMTQTTNGQLSHVTTNSSVLDAFFKFVRDADSKDIRRQMRIILNEHEESHENALHASVDAFLLWASSRDIRDGKGERSISHVALCCLLEKFPNTVCQDAFISLITEYGGWMDFGHLYDICDRYCPGKHVDHTETYDRFKGMLVSFYAKTLLDDEKKYEGKELDKLTLAAKWAPRETSKSKSKSKSKMTNSFFKALRDYMFFHPDKHDVASASYRKLITKLNVALNTTEVLMSNNLWQNIAPGAVPALSLSKHRRAFLNQPRIKKNKKLLSVVRSTEMNRIECAKNFCEHIKSNKGMHGRVLHPHEIVKKYNIYEDDDAILEEQWKDIIKNVSETVSEDDSEPKSHISKMVPVVDTSGSMMGTPLEAALAIGLIISETTHESLRHRVLTFDAVPKWHKLDPAYNLRHKLQCLRQAPWGMNTNLTICMQLVLDVCLVAIRRETMTPEDVADLNLVVLSDMQFDQSRINRSEKWETQFQQIQSMYACHELEPPTITFWNLRANTNDVPVNTETKGVNLVSGFSANLLKLFLNNELLEKDECDLANGEVAVKPKADPMTVMRAAFDKDKYDTLRDLLKASNEGILEAYV
jgi:hypothetical protein